MRKLYICKRCCHLGFAEYTLEKEHFWCFDDELEYEDIEFEKQHIPDGCHYKLEQEVLSQ